MKSLLTVSSVVFAHICVFLLLVNGCHGPSNAASDWDSGTKTGTHIYSGGARNAMPAEAIPEEPVPATATPAQAEPERVPAEAAPAQPAQQTRAAPPVASDKEKIHYVKKGEVLSMIALRNGLTSKELADANGIPLSSTLQIGQKLIIPAPKAKVEEPKKAQTEGDVYVVQKGDVLGIIARKHKVSVKQIKEANNLKNDVIRVGQKLIIPSKNAKTAQVTPKAEETAAPAEPAKVEEKKADVAEAKPVEAVPVKEEAKETVIEENFGMPEGGFGEFGDSAKKEDAVPVEAVPSK